MIRTAMRLSTQAALMNGGIAPWPTLAGSMVYDSRKDDVTDLLVGQANPIIILRTDEDTRNTRDPRNAGRPSDAQVMRDVMLRLEFGLMMVAQRRDANNVVMDVPVWAQTDAHLEVLLDLMEWQIENALTGFGPWGLVWTQHWARFSMTSTPIWTNPDQGRIRRAVRELSIDIRGAFDLRPRPYIEDDGMPEKVLPEPLRSVLDMIITKGGGFLQAYATTVRDNLLLENLPQPLPAPMLKQVKAVQPAPNLLKSQDYGN